MTVYIAYANIDIASFRCLYTYVYSTSVSSSLGPHRNHVVWSSCTLRYQLLHRCVPQFPVGLSSLHRYYHNWMGHTILYQGDCLLKWTPNQLSSLIVRRCRWSKATIVNFRYSYPLLLLNPTKKYGEMTRPTARVIKWGPLHIFIN